MLKNNFVNLVVNIGKNKFLYSPKQKKMLTTETELQINPKMLVLARESRGLSQKELADKLSISPALLCKIEQESRTLGENLSQKMSAILKYPVEFFYQEGEAYMPMSLNYRKREHVAQKLLLPLEANINLYRLNVETLLKKIKFPAVKLPIIDLKKYESIEKMAKGLRKQWKVPKGPIDNITELLERNGIIVISFDFGTERVDSRTIYTHDKQPIIILNKTMLGDRKRFSLAHELGHLIMHAFTMPSFDRDITHEANMFAAGFLLPQNEVKKDFENGVNIALLGELKRKWKVSMQALLFRASDLGFLTENQKHYLLKQFNQLKIRRREPPELDIPKEKPVLLRGLIAKYKSAQRFSVKEMAEILNLTDEEFLKKYTD